MNIICNNCVGARLYEVTKQQFPNPFMWMAISSDDFIKIVKNYDSLDFDHPEFSLEKYSKNSYDTVLVTLNNDIKLHYIHYIQDVSKDEPVKEKSTNILYKDILTYAKNKWFSRLHRSSEEPTFLYSFNYTLVSDRSYMLTLDKLRTITSKKLLILVHSDVETGEFPDNVKVVKCNQDIMNLNGSPLARAVAPLVFDRKF